MIHGLIMTMVGKGLPDWLARIIFWSLVVFIALSLAGLAVWQHDRKVIRAHEAATTTEGLKNARAADAVAADYSGRRDLQIREARRGFDNATAHLPKHGLSDRQRLDICNELREAGTDTSRIAECKPVNPRGATGP